jgi:hypothetical protein
MAQLITWLQSSWIGDMPPGAVHPWTAWGGIQPGDVFCIMAHPVVGNPNAPERVLQVENVRAEGTPNGVRRIYYSVRNAGPDWITGYSKTYMMLRP